jgi:hypothetical protein
MSIKYGDVTIIHNTCEDVSIWTSISSIFGFEQPITKQCKVVFLFDDGEICEVNDKLKDFKFDFFKSVSYRLPLYFEKNKTMEQNKVKCNNIYFYKKPVEKDNLLRLDFSSLFASYKRYNPKINTRTASVYNCIYYCYKDLKQPDVFGLVRIKSSETMPRYQFAYDCDEFTEEEVIYLIHSILCL